MMRIITGKARGTHLATLEGVHTRPTAERTKEAVFSMLRGSIPDAEVLDLFAGSGQLALEALSQGAKRAVLCDSARDAIRIIRANAEKTHLLPQCEIVCADAASVLSRYAGTRKFDLVFLDPPYATRMIPQILETLDQKGMLSADARVMCETANAEDVFGELTHLTERYEILRTSRYGAAYVTILTPKGEGEA